MKKILLLIILLSCILTGCGKKSVVCDGSITESGVTADIEVTGNFDNNKLKEQQMKIEFDLTDYLEYATLDTYYESFKTQYEKFSEYEGISVDVSKGENSIIVNMIIDLDIVDAETYEKLDIGNGATDVTVSQFKDEFENKGLTCNKE